MLNESGVPEENRGKMIEDKYIQNVQKIQEVDSDIDSEEAPQEP